MPKVSVIIPNYNHERFLIQRIESVLNQTYRDFEIIILDDCSSDGSKLIIEKYRAEDKVIKIIYNDSNSGTTFKQWETGIKASSGKYIWIAESDDYASPYFLETLIKPFGIYPELVISYCRSCNVDDKGQNLGLTLHADQLDPAKWTKDYIEIGSKELKHYLQYRNTIPNASAVLFKKPKNLKNLLSTESRYTGDWLFWKNLLLENNSKIAYCATVLNYFRMHEKSTRDLTVKSTLEAEIRRFKEYKSFVPKTYLNPFDERFRWIMAEWIDRGVPALAGGTIYAKIPLLHPTLIMRYYMYVIKGFFTAGNSDKS